MLKHFKYLSYVVRHKWFVLLAGLKTEAPIWNLLIHDWTKFLPSEWIPYARFFYGKYPSHEEWLHAAKMLGLGYCRTQEQVKEAFDVAWLHHQSRNRHHWQYWVLLQDSGFTKALRMPDRYVREMVADWAGAGRAITGKWDVEEWYRENAFKMKLHGETKLMINELIGKVMEGTQDGRQA